MCACQHGLLNMFQQPVSNTNFECGPIEVKSDDATWHPVAVFKTIDH